MSNTRSVTSKEPALHDSRNPGSSNGVSPGGCHDTCFRPGGSRPRTRKGLASPVPPPCTTLGQIPDPTDVGHEATPAPLASCAMAQRPESALGGDIHRRPRNARRRVAPGRTRARPVVALSTSGRPHRPESARQVLLEQPAARDQRSGLGARDSSALSHRTAVSRPPDRTGGRSLRGSGLG